MVPLDGLDCSRKMTYTPKVVYHKIAKSQADVAQSDGCVIAQTYVQSGRA